MKIQALLCTLVLATLGSVAAKADDITITLDQATQTASAGDTLQFFGTITNDTDTTLYLNNDDLTLNGLSLTLTDDFFNTPISLAPEGQAGDNSGDIELFDVTVSDPLLDAAGTYTGAYTLLGGTDGGSRTSSAPPPSPSPASPLPPEPASLFPPPHRHPRAGNPRMEGHPPPKPPKPLTHPPPCAHSRQPHP